jgi:hypothetical protein
MATLTCSVHPAAAERELQLKELGDEIAELAAHLDAAIPAVPPPAPVPDEPVAAVQAKNEALGLHISAHTAMPSWLGERLDLGYAIAVLHPLAVNARP